MWVIFYYRPRLRLRREEQDHRWSNIRSKEEVRKALQRGQERFLVGSHLRSVGQFYEKVYQRGKEHFSWALKIIESLWVDLRMLAREDLHWLKLDLRLPKPTSMSDGARKAAVEVWLETSNGHSVLVSRKVFVGSGRERSTGRDPEGGCWTEKGGQMSKHCLYFF